MKTTFFFYFQGGRGWRGYWKVYGLLYACHMLTKTTSHVILANSNIKNSNFHIIWSVITYSTNIHGWQNCSANTSFHSRHRLTNQMLLQLWNDLQMFRAVPTSSQTQPLLRLRWRRGKLLQRFHLLPWHNKRLLVYKCHPSL